MIKPVLVPEVANSDQDHMTGPDHMTRPGHMAGSDHAGQMMRPDQLMLVVEVGQVKLALPPRLSKIVQLFNEVGNK